jgi:hypothetical protein
MNFKNYFEEINFDKFNVVEFVKARKALDNSISSLKELVESSNIQEFNTITIAAYGYLYNPYKNVYQDIKTFIDSCEQIVLERFKTDLTLDYAIIGMTDKKTANLISINPAYYFINLEVFIKKLNRVLEAVDLLNNANKNKKEIFRKFLGINESSSDLNGELYEYSYSSGRGVWTKYSLNNDGKSMDINEYIYYDNNWTLYSSSDICRSISSQDVSLSEFGMNAFATLLPELVI